MKEEELEEWAKFGFNEDEAEEHSPPKDDDVIMGRKEPFEPIRGEVSFTLTFNPLSDIFDSFFRLIDSRETSVEVFAEAITKELKDNFFCEEQLAGAIEREGRGRGMDRKLKLLKEEKAILGCCDNKG